MFFNACLKDRINAPFKLLMTAKVASLISPGGFLRSPCHYLDL